MTTEERARLNKLLIKNQHKLHHVIADGLGALLDEVEEFIPATVGDELILAAQMDAIVIATLGVAVLMETRGGMQSRLDDLSAHLSGAHETLQKSMTAILTATAAQFKEELPVERQVPFYERPEVSSFVGNRPMPSVVLGRQDEKGNLIPQTDDIQ